LSRYNKTQKLPPEERIKILALSRIDGLGPRTFQNLLDNFEDIKNIFNAKKRDLEIVIPPSVASYIRSKKYLEGIEAYLNSLQESGISFFTILDKEYPKLLREIYDPPIVLYYKGDFNSCDFDKCFSVVGTRASTRYGKEVTGELVSGLVEAGFVIVSGMAFGIDKLAHKQAIKSEGKTVAVLSGRPDQPSPYSNYKVYEEILTNGCILSEAHLDEEIYPGMFPKRNRIISALSRGVLVVEAGEKSGALITAYQALEQGRDVFAVPGNITNEKSRGTNKLIKNGNAKLVGSIYDILEEFGFKKQVSGSRELVTYTDSEQRIIDVLVKEGATIDEITQALEWDISRVLQLLTMMEIEGKVAKDEREVYFITK
jgi:DNA processing protein